MIFFWDFLQLKFCSLKIGHVLFVPEEGQRGQHRMSVGFGLEGLILKWKNSRRTWIWSHVFFHVAYRSPRRLAKIADFFASWMKPTSDRFLVGHQLEPLALRSCTFRAISRRWVKGVLKRIHGSWWIWSMMHIMHRIDMKCSLWFYDVDLCSYLDLDRFGILWITQIDFGCFWYDVVNHLNPPKLHSWNPCSWSTVTSGGPEWARRWELCRQVIHVVKIRFFDNIADNREPFPRLCGVFLHIGQHWLKVGSAYQSMMSMAEIPFLPCFFASLFY